MIDSDHLKKCRKPFLKEYPVTFDTSFHGICLIYRKDMERFDQENSAVYISLRRLGQKGKLIN